MWPIRAQPGDLVKMVNPPPPPTHTHTSLLKGPVLRLLLKGPILRLLLKGPVLHLLRTRSAGWTTMHLLLQSLVRTQDRLDVTFGGYLEEGYLFGLQEKKHKGMKMPSNVQRQWEGKLEDFGVRRGQSRSRIFFSTMLLYFNLVGNLGSEIHL